MKAALFLAASLALVCAASAFVGGALPAMTPRAASASAVSGLSMMRHKNRLAKLGLPADQRKALLRSLTSELIRHGRITTTHKRAKAMRDPVDHMITLAKDGSLHARRQAMAYIHDKELVHALFEQAPERYADREGGYCRVVRTMPRKGDNSPMGIIELV
eukprot:CAMPEP_0173434562 /NCGR_PEP_ID=MMETSP1357-20121228/13117_1 /TAXON_ID=77926 /ORGANISM="Hemiselmis rufescens, Strain PCC563" /LENGTH=159 /DNA_ID=CAMNT_0014399439 /DNA_START=6 /DNA_END=485 /DNA_ORIENTATION=-